MGPNFLNGRVIDTKPLNLKLLCPMHSKTNTETLVLGEGKRSIHIGQNKKAGACVHSNPPLQEQEVGGFSRAKGLSRRSFSETRGSLPLSPWAV